MFLGQQLQQGTSLPLQKSSKHFATIQITNAALSKNSEEADLYLQIGGSEILLCELNRKLIILQKSLNVFVDLKEKPTLVSKNGNIHICGFYQVENENRQANQKKPNEAEINTNKKINSLESRFQKAETLPAESDLSVSLNAGSDRKQKTEMNSSSQQPTPRHSSRLSSRRSTSANVQPPKEIEQKKQKSSKKEQKSQKKQEKSSSLLSNGRYSLKALLQNVSNDDSDEDEEQFDDEGEDGQSDDDSEFEEDLDEQEDEPKKRTKASSNQGQANLRRPKSQQSVQKHQTNQRPRRQKVEPTHFPQQASNLTHSSYKAQQTRVKGPIQIVQEEQDQNKQQNTEQFQQKWPESGQSERQKENNKRYKIIEELASKMKCPTKRPTI